MKKCLFLLSSALLISACSDPEYDGAERSFIKMCYYGTNFQIPKDLCSCSFEKLTEIYSVKGLSEILSKIETLDQNPSFQSKDLDNNILDFKEKFKYTLLQCK